MQRPSLNEVVGECLAFLWWRDLILTELMRLHPLLHSHPPCHFTLSPPSLSLPLSAHIIRELVPLKCYDCMIHHSARVFSLIYLP